MSDNLEQYRAFLERKRTQKAKPRRYPLDTSGRFHWPLDEFDAEFDGAGPLTYIYGLYDPRNGELRYVGKSDRPRERLMNQMNEKSNTHRCHWIQELLAAGMSPIQRIIDAVPRGEPWEWMERAYIESARLAGCRMTNGTDGGDGVSGLSEESLAKIRATWLGRKHRPESLAKMSAAHRGRKHTAEHRKHMHDIMVNREFSEEHRSRIRKSIQKLTNGQVREIRCMLEAGVSQYVIAEKYAVHQGTISNIARGRTYRDVR